MSRYGGKKAIGVMLFTASLMVTAIAAKNIQPTEQFTADEIRSRRSAAGKPTTNTNDNDNDHIVIHVVAHTHDDVGWLETVDEYYLNEVQWILDTTVRCLMENPSRRFTYVEIAYFFRWWNEQSDAMKADVAALVKNGQLEFNLGGWCMNDEATTYYAQEIEQMGLGAGIIKDAFDVLPMVGWHVDPFGHSAATPSMWAQMGMSAFGMNRIDYRLKNHLMDTKELEFVWRSSDSQGNETDMWVHIMPYHYCTPGECGYDGGLTVNTDPTLPTYQVNVQQQASDFVTMARQRSSLFKHDQVLIPFGCDFAHQNAFHSFMQMDKLIDFVNSDKSLNATVIYSTFATYVQAVHGADVTWNVWTPEETDFFPYASSLGAYWTGYYTSRPKLKGLVRKAGSILRTGNQMGVFANDLPGQYPLENLEILRKAQGVTQHHDAVSGTEKQHVSDDYTLQLNNGINATGKMMESVAGQFLGKSHNNPPLQLSLDMQAVNMLGPDQFLPISVYNSLGWIFHDYIQVAINRSDVVVLDAQGGRVQSQVNPVLPFDNNKQSNFTLFFAAEIPPVGMRVYFLQVDPANAVVGKVSAPGTAPAEVATSRMSLSFTSDGFLSAISNLESKVTTQVRQEYWQYYSSFEGGQNSGAYVFRPAVTNVLGVGSENNNPPYKSGKWTFMNSYPQSSKLVAFVTPQAASQYNDTFLASVQGLKNTELDVIVGRADPYPANNPWGQSVSTNFLVLDVTQSPPYYTGIQVVSAAVNPLSTNESSTTAKVTFNSVQSAGLICSATDSQPTNNLYIVSVDESSTTDAMVMVTRWQGQGWGEQLTVSCLVFDATTPPMLPKNEAVVGVAKVSAPSSGGVWNTTVKFPATMDAEAVPVCIAAADNTNKKVIQATVTDDIGQDHVRINFACAGCDFAEDDTITVNYHCFQRRYFVETVNHTSNVNRTVVSGPFIMESWTSFRSDYTSEVFRLYELPTGANATTSPNHVEIVNNIGPMDKGRELVTRFITNLTTGVNATSGVFYTEDNGLEMQKRVYNLEKDEPVAGNYYPVTQRALIRDNTMDSQFTMVVTRAHGCASLESGSMECMLHRRCLADDGFGVGEVLDEDDTIQPKMWLVVDTEHASSVTHRHLGLIKEYQPTSFFGAPVSTIGAFTSKYLTSTTELVRPLPPAVHLLSLEASLSTPTPMDTIRIQHIFPAGEHPVYSNPVTLDLSKIFISHNVSSLAEMNLSGSTVAKDIHRLQWKTKETDGSARRAHKRPEENLPSITLLPRDIRTFVSSPKSGQKQ